MNSTIALPRAAAALALLLAPAAAQFPLSGSESYVLAARAASVAGGELQSASYRGFLAVRPGAPAEAASSAGYELVAGVQAGGGALASGPPVLFGSAPSSGGVDGGESLTVFGFNLDDGTGAAALDVGGVPAGSVAVLSGAALQAVAPPGANAFGNPKGAVPLSVQNAGGTALLEGGWVYTPALLQAGPARVGQVLELRYQGPPGCYHQLSIGPGLGTGVPIPPLAGALELNPILQLTPFEPVETGTLSVLVPIAGDPALVGVVAEFQDVAVTSLAPLAGTFTNLLAVPIEP